MDIENVVTVAGAKGGVGKTTTSINVGATAAADGLRTVVVELDLAMANVQDFLSIPCDDDDPTLHDVLAGEAGIEDAVYVVGENFAVAPSGTDLDGYTGVDFDRLPDVLDTLQSTFDLVVIDTGAGLSRATVEPIRLADTVVLVSTPRVAAIRDGDKTRQIAERLGTPVSGLVLSKSGTGSAPEPDRIAEFLDVTLLGHVPDDDAIPVSQDKGVPVADAAPDSTAARKYRTVTGNLLFRLDTGLRRDQSGAVEGQGPLSDEQLSSVSDAVSVDPEPAIRHAIDPSTEQDESESPNESSEDADESDPPEEPTEETSEPGPAADEGNRPTAAADGHGRTSVVRRLEDTVGADVNPEYPTPDAVVAGDALTGDDADSDTDAAETESASASGDGDTGTAGEDGDAETEASILSRWRSRFGL